MGFAFEVHAKREGPSKESNDYSPREINNEKLKIKLKKWEQHMIVPYPLKSNNVPKI